MATDTIFSKIIRKEIPAKIVFESESVLAFHDVNPQAPVHILIIPKMHIVSLAHAQPDHQKLLGELLICAQQIAKQLDLENGYRVVINTGNDGGQSVFHLHLHLMGGRMLGWPPG
jgi:histidine triad (HIT) family protein